MTDGVCILELTVNDSYVAAWCKILLFLGGGVASLFSVSSGVFEVNLLVVKSSVF